MFQGFGNEVFYTSIPKEGVTKMKRLLIITVIVLGAIAILLIRFSESQQISAREYGLVAEWSKQYPEIKYTARECFHYDHYISPKCFNKIEREYQIFKIQEIMAGK